MLFSLLAAMSFMAAGNAQAGGFQVSSGAYSFNDRATTSLGGPLQKLTVNSASTDAQDKLSLQFPGAPVTGPAGLSFTVNAVLSLLTHGGLLATSPTASGTSTGASLTLGTSTSTAFRTVGVISNSTPATLTKTGAGSLTLSGASSPTLTQGTLTMNIAGGGTAAAGAPLTLTGNAVNSVGAAGNIIVSTPITSTGTATVGAAGAGTLILTSSANTFSGPLVIVSGSLVLAVATSLDETDPGTAFSESNPVSLVDTEAGALFPVGATVRVNGLMNPSATSPTATVVNHSGGTMIIKRTSSGGLSFMVPSGPP